MKSSNTLHDLDGACVSPPQAKICGLSRPEEALACAEFGAAAVGCVFYPPSPRCVTEEQAREICRSLPARVCTVGVFVNETFADIMRKVNRCGLRAVQLHGREGPELAEKLLDEGVTVIRVLYVNQRPSIETADCRRASAFLVECAGGPLPGGNARVWDWGAAAEFCRRKPAILAGGLDPDNVAQAIEAASPDAVDVSSGVESAPGKKDIQKIKLFLERVRRSSGGREPRVVFR